MENQFLFDELPPTSTYSLILEGETDLTINSSVGVMQYACCLVLNGSWRKVDRNGHL